MPIDKSMLLVVEAEAKAANMSPVEYLLNMWHDCDDDRFYDTFDALYDKHREMLKKFEDTFADDDGYFSYYSDEEDE